MPFKRLLLYGLLFTIHYFTPDVLHAQSKRPVVLNGNTIIYTSAKPGEPLYLAVVNLQRDLNKVLGKSISIHSLDTITSPGIVIATEDKDKLANIVSGWEAHHLYVGTIGDQQQVILEGADMRGTIYAIYTFSDKVLGMRV